MMTLVREGLRFVTGAGRRGRGFERIPHERHARKKEGERRDKNPKGRKEKTSKKDKKGKASSRAHKREARESKAEAVVAYAQPPVEAQVSEPKVVGTTKRGGGYRGDEWMAPKQQLCVGARETGVKVVTTPASR